MIEKFWQKFSSWLPLVSSFIGMAFLIIPAIDGEWITQEIHYYGPEVDAVYLVWGINNWKTVPEDVRPPDTSIVDSVMQTRMEKVTESYVTQILVPPGATIDYGFLLVDQKDGDDTSIWDANGSGDYHSVVDGRNAIIVKSNLIDLDPGSMPIHFQYHVPEAGEVELIWGVNGWNLLTDIPMPANTIIRDQLMVTTMDQHDDGTFSTTITIPMGSSLDYGFSIKTKRDGTRVDVWEDGGELTDLTINQTVEVDSQVSLTESREFASVTDVAAYVLLGVALLILIIGIISRFIDPDRRASIYYALLLLFIFGLLLRVGHAWHTNQILPDTAERLVGDEPGFDFLAKELLQGRFFQWPARVPVYPLFLALSYIIFGQSYARVLYVQAVVNALAIPLTYILARRFTDRKKSLVAAAIVTIHPILISHVSRIYSEAVYTPLLLLTLIAFVWAIKSPNWMRFSLAGVLSAVLTLTRPITLLLPIILPIVLPKSWTIRSRMTASVIFTGSMFLVIAPWTYHNYIEYGEFVPLSATTYAFWEASPEFYHLMKEGMNSMQIFDAYVNAENNGGYNSSTLEGSSYFNARAIASIRSEPFTYLEYSIRKPFYFWFGHPANQWEWPFDFDWQYKWYSATEIAKGYLSRLLPVVALLVLLAGGRKIRIFFPLVIFITYFMLMHTISVPEVRYSEPLHPLLAIIAVGGSAYLVRGSKGWSALTKNRLAIGPLNGLINRRNNYTDLLYELVARDLKLRYRRSHLGILWALINPLLQLLVLGLVFSFILPLDIELYSLFLFVGLLPWIWFQSSLLAGTSSIVDNRGLIRRPGFSSPILPMVSVSSNMVHFMLSLPVVFIMSLLMGATMGASIVLLPLIILVQFVFTLGITNFLATLHVKFRDTQHLVGVILLLWFYLTPIFYNIDTIPERYQAIFALNPMLHIINAYRDVLMYGQWPKVLPLVLIGAVSIVAIFVGHHILLRASNKFVEEL